MTAEAAATERATERAPAGPGPGPATAEPLAGSAGMTGWTPAAPIHRLRPPQLNTLQGSAGNGAVQRLLGGERRVQRAPSAAAAAPKATAPKAPAAASLNSYIDLLNGFQDLAAAYVNKEGAGLGQLRFGTDLSGPHRSLLHDVRTALVEAISKDPSTRVKARGAWRYASAKLLTAVEESRTVGMPGDEIAAVIDAISIINKKLGSVRGRADEPESESIADYNDVLRAANLLLYYGSRLQEGSVGLQREEVSGRKDIEVSDAIRELNQKHRDEISGVKLGANLIARHRRMLETLRAALIALHSEAPGSSVKAWQLWSSCIGQLRYAVQRGSTYGGSPVDVSEIQKNMDAIAAKLSAHYYAVRQEKLQGILTKPRSKGDLKERKEFARKFGGDRMVAAVQESIATEDAEAAFDVIQHYLAPLPDHPGMWVIRNGQTVMVISEQQALGLREAAAKAIKGYMQSLYSALLRAQVDYEDILRGTNKFKRSVLGFFGGADDPGSFGEQVGRLGTLRDKSVDPLVDAGQFVEAFKLILAEKPAIEASVKREHDYDMDLDKGHNRLATTMQVVQVALVSLVPVAGEAALASAPAWAVAGTSVVAGSGGAAIGETTRQVVAGEGSLGDRLGNLEGGKIGSAAWSGGVIGASAVAPAATRKLGGALESAGFGSAGGEFVASTVVGGTQSKLGGGDFLEGAAGGGLGWGAGKLTAPLGQGVPGKVAQTVTGAGVGYVTSGGDPNAAISGATGSLAGSFATAPGHGTSGKKPAPEPGERPAAGPAAPAVAPAGPAAPAVAPVAPAVSEPPAPAAGAPAADAGSAPKTPGPPVGASPPASTLRGTGIQERPPASPAATATTSGTGGKGALLPGTGERTAAGSIDLKRTGAGSGSRSSSGGSSSGRSPSGASDAVEWMGRQADSDLPTEPVGAAIGRGDPKAAKPDVNLPDARIKGDVGVGNMFKPAAPRQFKTLGRPGGGTSDSIVVLDRASNRKYLFKPIGGEPTVPYAEARGVVAGHYAERARAGAIAAGELGVATPDVQLVEINGRKGSLTEWVEPSPGAGTVMGLDKLAQSDPAQFRSMQSTKEFKEALSGVQALDYLVNNVDRVNNLGNYMIELTPDGRFSRLIPIDQELAFTRTPDRAVIPGRTSMMPEVWTPGLADKVAALKGDPTEFANRIRPLVGDKAVEGVLARLDQLYNDGVRRGAIKPAPRSASRATAPTVPRDAVADTVPQAAVAPTEEHAATRATAPQAAVAPTLPQAAVGPIAAHPAAGPAGPPPSGGSAGTPAPGYEDVYHDPVAASQLLADHVLRGRPMRLVGRGEGERVWRDEYGGSGRTPAAWYEPGNKLVVDTAQLPVPVRSADILQGPVRPGGVAQPPIPTPGAAGPTPTPNAGTAPTQAYPAANAPTEPYTAANRPTVSQPAAAPTATQAAVAPTEPYIAANRPTVSEAAAAPTEQHPSTRPTLPQAAIAPTARQPVVGPSGPTTPPGGGAGGGDGGTGPAYGDVYHDPVAASQLLADHVVLGGPMRLIGRGEGSRVWHGEYGGTGPAPAAWYEPGGKLVVDTARLPMPVRSADILQGPIRQGGGAPPPSEEAPGPAPRRTLAGIGGDGRGPAAPAHDTQQGPGIDPRAPAQPGGDTVASNAGPLPARAQGPSRRGAFAKLPEYATHAPLFGDVVATIEDGDKAAQLYDRVYREGQRRILETTHPDATEHVWVSDAGFGQGEPPAAWIRADGTIRFNLAKFKRPDFSDLHPPVPFTPTPAPGPTPKPLLYEYLVRPDPGVSRPPKGFVRLPEYAGLPPLFPDSRVTSIIDDPDAATALYVRVKQQSAGQSISHTTHEDATAVAWAQVDGQGKPPAAWIRTDGTVHFNFAEINHPDAQRAREAIASQQRPGAGAPPPPPSSPPDGAAPDDPAPEAPAPSAAPDPRRTAPGIGIPPTSPAPPAGPGAPSAMQSAEIELDEARAVRAAAEARLEQARAATRGASNDADKMLLSTAEAQPAVEVAEARLAEARALQKVAAARLGASPGPSDPDHARLGREAAQAESDVGYAEMKLHAARNAAVGTRRVAEGIAASRANDAVRAERMNVQRIDDPDEAAQAFLGKPGAKPGLRVSHAEYERRWAEFHRQGSPAPGGGWRQHDGTVVIDGSNQRVVEAVTRMAQARKAAQGGGAGPASGSGSGHPSDSDAIPAPIDDPNEGVPEPIDDPSRPLVVPRRMTPSAVPTPITPEKTDPISAPQPDDAVPHRIEPDYARPRVGGSGGHSTPASPPTPPTAPAAGPATGTDVADIPAPEAPAPDYEEMEVKQGGALGRTTTVAGNRRRTTERKVGARPVSGPNATVARYSRRTATDTTHGHAEDGTPIKSRTSSEGHADLGLKGAEAGTGIEHTTRGGTTVGAGAEASVDTSGNISLVGSLSFRTQQGLTISPHVGHSDQSDASDPQYVEGVGFLVSFRISSTDSVGVGGGKAVGPVDAGADVGTSRASFQSGSRIFKTLQEANDFRDNVGSRARRGFFEQPPTTVAGALMIPPGESRGAGTATATTIGASASIADGLGTVGYSHVSTTTEDLSILRTGPTSVDVTRTFSEDTTGDPHISGLGMNNTKGQSDETGRAVTFSFDLSTDSGKAAFARWCQAPMPPGEGATNRRVKTFLQANAHDEYGFPVKFSAAWKSRHWESHEVDEAGHATDIYGGGQDRDTRTGWVAENITRDKEQHANAQIEATLKDGKESYLARFTVSGKSGSSNLEEFGKIFSGANHDPGDSSGYWLLTAQIDPAVVHRLEQDMPDAFRNARTTQEKMQIYRDYEEKEGARMIGGQVRAGGHALAWNLELPGDPNFPGAAGREQLNQQRASLQAQLKAKPDSAGSVASQAKDTIDELKRRRAAVTDKRQYTDLPDELRNEQRDLIDTHLAEYRSLRSQALSAEMRGGRMEDPTITMKRAADPHGYDDVKMEDRAWRFAQDLVAIHEWQLGVDEQEIIGTRGVVQRLFDAHGDVRWDRRVQARVYEAHNQPAKEQFGTFKALAPKLAELTLKMREQKEKWAAEPDPKAREAILREYDGSVLSTLQVMEAQLAALRAAAAEAYIVASESAVTYPAARKVWQAINANGAARENAVAGLTDEGQALSGSGLKAEEAGPAVPMKL